jgi:hypothetical protein
MRLEIQWEVCDGYCGKSRPQTLQIETEDYLEADTPYETLSEDEKRECIVEWVEGDFQSKVTYSIKSIKEY